MSNDLPDDWYEDHDGQSLVLNSGKVEAEIEKLRHALRDASLNLTVLIEAAKSVGNHGLAESVAKFRSEVDTALRKKGPALG